MDRYLTAQIAKKKSIPFPYVKIGDQFWSRKNLDISSINGITIPEVQLASNNVNLIPSASSDFETDGTAYYNYIIRCTKEYNSTEKCLRLIGTATGDDVAFGKTGVLTIGKLYRIEFDIKSSNTNIAIPGLQPAAFGNINVIQAAQLSTNYQTFIAEGISLTGNIGLYATYASGVVGATYDIDNVKVYEKGWADLTTPAWCYQNNDPALGAIYGKIYNWHAVQVIAPNLPDKWTIPIQSDFINLGNYLGGFSVAGGKLKKEGSVNWNSPNTGATDEFGFGALGGGMRKADGTFIYNKVLSTMATLDKYLANTYYGYCVIYNSTVLATTSYHEAPTEKSGQYIRVIRR